MAQATSFGAGRSTNASTASSEPTPLVPAKHYETKRESTKLTVHYIPGGNLPDMLVLEEHHPTNRLEPLQDLGLTHRQAEILALVVDACSNAEIAHELDIAESTVKKHMANAFKTLGVTSRTAAAVRAVEVLGPSTWPNP